MMRKHKARQSRRNRPGSIMIMVVALLVLMALIGTAYIATARYDRGSAVQNSDNVQIEILVDSVGNLCKTAVAGDLFDGNGVYRAFPRDPFKPLNDPTNPVSIPNGALADTYFYYNTTSTHFDTYTNLPLDYWLADRTPAFGATPVNNTKHYYWGRISDPLTTENSSTGPIRGFFEDPTYVQSGSGPLILRFTADSQLEPTSINVNGVPMPAFKGIKTGVATLDPYTGLAADADGDGIADSLLVRMPIGTINGITYYYAVRIVDNAAAINLNTAWADLPVNSSGANIGDGRRLFPTSINLIDLITAPSPNAEFDRINMFRTQAPPPYNPGSGVPVQLNSPITDASIARTDFQFYDEHDALWMQLGRRPENPGYIPNSSIANWQHYRAFPLSDMIALSPHFVFNYSYDVAAAEGVLPGTLGGPRVNGGGTRTKPYAPDDVNNGQFSWGPQNFGYDSSSGQDYSRRPLLVTSNSVSNAISGHRMPKASIQNYNPDKANAVDVATSDMLNYSSTYRGGWLDSNTKYVNGDIVRKDGQYFICAVTNTTSTGKDPTSIDGQQFWEYQPWTPTPQKASLNTASFRELYRAYWNVMCGSQPDKTPYGDTPAPGLWDPYALNGNYQHQFKSSLRDVRKPINGFDFTVYRFSPFQQLLLRSALAAVNTIDIRDSDDDVTVRRIYLNLEGETTSGNGTRQVEVTLYGCEKQPFMTEVYAHADNSTTYNGQINKNGYVAIELFNPYDAPIKMNNWKLGLVDRRRPVNQTPDATRHTIRPIDLPATLTIPAGGYLVLENFSTNPAETKSAKARPPRVTVTGTPVYVRDLYRVFDNEIETNEVGGELILLRPRRADGIKTSGIRSYDPLRKAQPPGFNEANTYDLVPVDQFDFTGLKLHKPGTTGVKVRVDAWHYVRKNGTGDNRWKCVYPGPYDAGKSPDTERHKLESKFWDAPLDKTDVTDPEYVKSLPAHKVDLGKPDDYATYPNNFPPIQVNNRDAAGPYHLTGDNDLNNPYPGAGLSAPNRYRNQFPFGGFQRVGDVMQVPYFGAYRVREVTQLTGGSALLANNEDVFLELNSLPMDCLFAEDADTADDSVENIGRFSPILPELVSAANYKNYYDFGKRIFDYFTVIAPHDDYFPNVNPDRTRDVTKDNTTAYRYYDGTTSRYRPLKQIENDPAVPPAKPAEAPQHAEVVKNIDPGTGSDAPEDNVGVHGLININTANWKVLSTVPFTTDPITNAKIAKAIVLYRDGDPSTGTLPQGPFQSLFDLYKVPEFINSQAFPISNTRPDDDDGDFSPFNSTLPPNGAKTDGITDKHEFERQFLLITRISNLLTTRSDSFTAYILVQGWRNPNTPQAELVVQRRAAMLIDRSGVTSINREARSMLIPVE